MGIWRYGGIGTSSQQRRWNNHPDITVVDHTAQDWMFVHFSMPWDKNVVTKEDEKIQNYWCSPLAKETGKMHQASTQIVPLVVGCLGVMTS